jgi:hypothetical protein
MEKGRARYLVETPDGSGEDRSACDQGLLGLDPVVAFPGIGVDGEVVHERSVVVRAPLSTRKASTRMS